MSVASEDLLLLLLTRAVRDEAAAARARDLLASPLDWDLFVESSIRHGVTPLVHDALEREGARLGAAAAPAGVRKRLAELASISARRNDRLLATTGEAVDVLAAAGVRALGLKELGLGTQVYAAPGLRPMGDVDLLVDRDRFDAAARALERLGYRTLPRADIPFTRRYAWAHHLRRAADEVWIDLQWNVMQRQWADDPRERFVFQPAVLWDGAGTTTLPGASHPLHVPAKEPMLLHLCGHLEGHQYGELVLFADIDQALARWGESFDWEQLAALAERFGMRGTVGHVLDLCSRLLATPIPVAARRRFAGATFRGPLFDATFSGLGPQHLALDDIVDAARPPRQVIDRLEQAARLQAARSAAIYERIDELLTALEAAGVRPVCDGTPAGRVFPEPGPGAVPCPRLVVADADREPLEKALVAAGLSGPGHASLTPASLAGADAPQPLALDVRVRSGLAALLEGDHAGDASNRSAALELIRRRLGRGPSTAEPIAVIDVVVATRPELLLWLLCRAGGAESHSLYMLPDVIDVVGDGAGAVSVAGLARTVGVSGLARRGLAMACDLMPEAAELERLREALGGPEEIVHPLQWAREGPAGLVRFGDLRRPFLLLLSLLSAVGVREHLGAVRAACSRGASARSPFARALGSLWVAVRRARSRRTGDDEPALVYWLDP